MEKIEKVKGFLWIRNEVFDNENLNGSDILVYAALMRYMNNETKECYPSIKKIAMKSRLTKNTVHKSLKVLEKEKLIYRKIGKGRANRYVILEPPTPSSPNFGNTKLETGGIPKEGKGVYQKKETNNNYINNTYINNTNNSDVAPNYKKIFFNYQTGKFVNLTEEYKAELKKQYPNCDIDKELKKMIDWLLDNSKKGRQGKRRFINNWLEKAQKYNTQNSDDEEDPLPLLK